jgi:phosphate starvation-inducible PhoH-like protein
VENWLSIVDKLDNVSVIFISESCISITINDSKKLLNVFGKNDENLRLIEGKIPVEIIPHGNSIQINGENQSIKIAKDVILDIINRDTLGINNSAEEVMGSIRVKINQDSLLNMENTIIKTKIKTIIPRSQNQNIYVDSIFNNPLTFGVGPAGTGKTYIAVAAAAYFLENKLIDRIILSRPAVEAGEKLGFLPGDLKEKIDPYLRPLYDALYDCLPANKVEKGLESNTIEIAPLAFMRGRTLENAFVILDEAQNCNTVQMKMFLTRLGINSKMVITGDPSQIDLPSNIQSGLLDALAVTKSIEEIEQVYFNSTDVVRHTLVAKIINAYSDAFKK